MRRAGETAGGTMEGIEFDLTYFSEGGAAGGAAGAEGAAGVPGAEAGNEGAGDQTANDERRAEFDAFIKANKDLYEGKLKENLDRRMKSSSAEISALRAQAAKYESLAASLAGRYGKDASDIDGIVEAVNGDTSWLEEQAARNGLTVEQQRHMNMLEAENQRFKAAREAAERQQQANETLSKWRQEAESLKQLYPDFDLDKEATNPDFADLLGKGVPMQAAYQVIHMDDIMTQGMQYAVQRTKDNVAASVRANGMRPTEGAGKNNAPTHINVDVSKLTKEQRGEYKRRAARGEEIYFG